MTDIEWVEQLCTLQRELGGLELHDEKSLRLALARLWRQLQTCPKDIFQAYRQLPTRSLRSEADRLLEQLLKGRLLYADVKTVRDMALQVGAQLWAIDEALTDRPGFAQPPVRPNSYLVPEIEAFVIPRTKPKLVDERTGPGRGFGRRGTPHHRVIPQVLPGNYKVELVWDARLSAAHASSSPFQFGAALLPGIRLGRDPKYPDWVALSADCEDDFLHMAEHVERSYDDAHLAVVYPELSMPPERVAALKGFLQARSRRMEVGKGPGLVAAGSWHVHDADGIRNIMPILDRSGVERMRYVKSNAYHRDGIEEGIIGDDRIPVLLNADFLATFAICLDFCEQEQTNPYLSMDVDYVIVASHGNDPPPLKWSALEYGFESLKEDGHGKTPQARRDRREAAAG